MSRGQPAAGLTRIEVRPNLYMVVGGGANSAFLVTDDGVVVVGAKESEAAGRELRNTIAGVTNQPVRYLILPNHQARYTHGCPIFPHAVVVTAHELARRHMLEPPEADFWTGLNAGSLPGVTFSSHVTFYLGRTRVEVVHPGAGETDGDLVVVFPGQHAIHTGDLFWNRRLPFIDRPHGGSAAGLLASMQRLLALWGADTLIPGYGDLGTRADLQKQIVLLRDLQTEVRQAIARHQSRAEVTQSLKMPAFAQHDSPERFHALVGAIFDELSHPSVRAATPAR